MDVSNENGVIFENNEMFIIIPKMNIYSLAKQEIQDYPGFSQVVEKMRYSSEYFINMEKIKEII